MQKEQKIKQHLTANPSTRQVARAVIEAGNTPNITLTIHTQEPIPNFLTQDVIALDQIASQLGAHFVKNGVTLPDGKKYKRERGQAVSAALEEVLPIPDRDSVDKVLQCSQPAVLKQSTAEMMQDGMSVGKIIDHLARYDKGSVGNVFVLNTPTQIHSQGPRVILTDREVSRLPNRADADSIVWAKDRERERSMYIYLA